MAVGNDAYLDDACRHALGLCDVLRDSANVLLHQSRGWVGVDQISPDHWSRGNGWGALALAELAALLPDGHPRRGAVDRALVDLLEARLRFQDAAGLWHQEITEPDASYVETSGSGLILFALGVALERGLLPAARRADFLCGLAGYSNYITDDGSVFHAGRDCFSPGDGSIVAYMARPPVRHDAHAFGQDRLIARRGDAGMKLIHPGDRRRGGPHPNPPPAYRGEGVRAARAHSIVKIGVAFLQGRYIFRPYEDTSSILNALS